MKKYGLVKNGTMKKCTWGVGEINYTALLAYVFGKPVKAEQAFLYFFRRYGLPNARHDDYKDLCNYLFHTNDKDIIVGWRMNLGDYHYHLCAFVDKAEWYEYGWKPIDEYHEQILAAAEKNGDVYFGGGFPMLLWEEKENGETEFIGNEIQRAAINKICEDYSDDDKDAWDKVFDRMKQNDKEIRKKYFDIKFPVIERFNRKNFSEIRYKQVEAGEDQHEWIMSLPEKHFLRRVYFAVKSLFENWKKQTYIRDQYFDMMCIAEPNPTNKTVSYKDFWEQKK